MRMSPEEFRKRKCQRQKEWARLHPEYRRKWESENPEYKKNYNSTYRFKKPEGWEKLKKRTRNRYLKNPASWLMAFFKSRAASRSLEFNLTHKWFQERLDRGICEVTGIPFILKAGSKTAYSRSSFQPSVDRKDHSKGYTINNCQLVCLIYNLSKGTYSHGDVLTMAHAIMTKFRNEDPLL